MKVFNLTDGNIDFRGKTIPAFRSVEFPDLKFVFPREMDLQRKGILSFGALPRGWKRPEPPPQPSVAEAVKAVAETQKVSFVETIKVEDNLVLPAQEAEEPRKEKKDDSRKWKK